MATGISNLPDFSQQVGFLVPPINSGVDPEKCDVLHETIITATGTERREVLLARLREVASAVEADCAERGVLTWIVFRNEDLDDEIRIFGRYSTKEDMIRHDERSEMVKFWVHSRDKGDIKKIERRGYVPNGKGWIKR